MVACIVNNLTPIKMLPCSDCSLSYYKQGFTKTLPRIQFIGGLAQTFVDHELQDIYTATILQSGLSCSESSVA